VTVGAHKQGTSRLVKSKTVFLVHGQDEFAKDQLGVFLSALGLHALCWREARNLVGVRTPTTLEIVSKGIECSQCALVLLTGEDIALLDSRLNTNNEPSRRQPRPNVLFEAGWALSELGRENTILVVIGSFQGISDIDGLNYIKMDNTAKKRRELKDQLLLAKCDVDESGNGWMDER
jgi:predicted nucleotide-binding protein